MLGTAPRVAPSEGTGFPAFRDNIDHAPGAHDDVANAVAGALVTAYKEPGVSNFRNVIVFPKVGVA